MGYPIKQTDTAATTGGAVETISLTTPTGAGGAFELTLLCNIDALPTTSESIVVKKLNMAAGTLDATIYNTDPSLSAGSDYSLMWVESVLLAADDQLEVTYANTDDNNIAVELYLKRL
jgi:hypothetical protein